MKVIKRFKNYWTLSSKSIKLRVVLFPFLFVLGIVITYIGLVISRDLGALLLNLGSGLLTAMIITILIDWLIGITESGEQRERELQKDKTNLLLQMRSSSREMVKSALENAKYHGCWRMVLLSG